MVTRVDPYLASGLILAALLIALYCVLEARVRRFPDLRALIEIVLAATAVTAGIRVGVLTATTEDLAPFKDEDRIYLFLGALALIVVSAQTILGVFRRRLEESATALDQ